MCKCVVRCLWWFVLFELCEQNIWARTSQCDFSKQLGSHESHQRLHKNRILTGSTSCRMGRCVGNCVGMRMGRAPRAYHFRGLLFLLSPPQNGLHEKGHPLVALVWLSEVNVRTLCVEVAGYSISFECHDWLRYKAIFGAAWERSSRTSGRTAGCYWGRAELATKLLNMGLTSIFLRLCRSSNLLSTAWFRGKENHAEKMLGSNLRSLSGRGYGQI